MKRIAWFHCFSGVAGDMALGALLHAGADIDQVRAAIANLPIDGWQLDQKLTQRNGIGGVKALVDVQDTAHDRSFGEIRDMLASAQLAPRVHERALRAFTALAEVEAGIHQTDVEHIHFHEVGSLDAIVDVVGVCAALESLGIDDVYCSPIAQGLGTIRAEHGILPNPVPAVIGLLARANAPTYGLDLRMELTTPTGAALMTTLATTFGPMPAMNVESVGYGAGGRTLPDRPNLVQVIIGTSTTESPTIGVDVVELAVNVDDVSGEVVAHTIASLLHAGAQDAWASAITMKKGRPAHTIHVLCDPAKAPELRVLLVRESGSMGVRATLGQKWPQARTEETVEVDGQRIRIKRAGHRVKVEFDDAQAAAAATGRPVREILTEAEAAGHTHR